MSQKHGKIIEHEEEILLLRAAGNSHRTIAEELGFTKYQIDKFFERYNKKQRKLAAGIIPRKRCVLAKDCAVTENDTVFDLRCKLVQKDTYIKRLEMENELMRDFLSLTERK